MAQDLIAQSGMQGSVTSTSGNLVYAFDADHQARVTADNFSIKTKLKQGLFTFDATASLDGTTTARYITLGNGEIQFAQIDDAGLHLKLVVNSVEGLFGSLKDRLPLFGWPTLNVQLRYTCVENSLQYTAAVAHAPLLSWARQR